MLRVVEAFSGIGSQVKALKNAGIEYEILATMDWDINAIIAYDIIHHGTPQIEEYKLMKKGELIETLKKYSLSKDGKKPITENGFTYMSKLELEHLLAAIKRSENLTSITSVNGVDLPNEIDLLTYSFPCQDLSIAGAWHGIVGGIDRDANNRSGMLWEVERILLERDKACMPMPKFLLMENVNNILSNTHKANFEDWQKVLIDLGYVNKIYTLEAQDFGIPQKRKRTFMVSVFCDKDNEIEKGVQEYLSTNDLGIELCRNNLNIKNKTIDSLLRIDYSNVYYRNEANEIQPNDTESRRRIYLENDLIYNGQEVILENISTITTKQDRNPNSGVIDYNSGRVGKSKFRYLTPRECFLLMGFDEEDFEALIDNNFDVTMSRKFFTPTKLYKFAGNSIVVNILEQIFRQIYYIKENILESKE